MKCPACDSVVTKVYYDLKQPPTHKGGSNSFVAIAYPCNHILGAVPLSWEKRLEGIEAKADDISQALGVINGNLAKIMRAIQGR